MPDLPHIPVPGQAISPSWFPAFWGFVRSLTPRGDNKTIRVSRGTGGSVFSLAPGVLEKSLGGGGGGGANAYAVITASSTTWVYTATIYTGLDASGDPAGAGTASQTVKVPTGYLASGETIANDTLLEVRKVDWDGTKYWTATQHIGLIGSA